MLYLRIMKIQFTSQIFREARMYVAYSPELDVSSCATTEAKAQKNLVEAVRLLKASIESLRICMFSCVPRSIIRRPAFCMPT